MGNKKSNSKSKTKVKKYLLIFIGICIVALLGNSDEPNTQEIANGVIEQNAVIDEVSEGTNTKEEVQASKGTNAVLSTVDVSNIPEYSDSPYIVINNNVPFFEDSDLTTSSFESYSELDNLGRCSVAVASVGKDIMPAEDRGSIGSVKPTGWHTVKYDGIDGLYLYNRCHLIGFQLTGENANTKNLITGTRYMNVEGMLPFENMVADYVKETNNHVMYRVTPIFEGNNLLVSGVVIEAKSVEDDGEGILFNVYCYNVQPGIKIDYSTGESSQESTESTENITTSSTTSIAVTAVVDKSDVISSNISTTEEKEPSNDTSQNAEVTPDKPETKNDTETNNENKITYVLNINTKKFHYSTCYSINRMKEENKQEYTGTRSEVIAMGYNPCGNCEP